MTRKITPIKLSPDNDDFIIIVEPTDFDPKSQQVFVSVDNKVVNGVYNPDTKSITAKIASPSHKTYYPFVDKFVYNSLRIKVTTCDIVKEKILSSKLQEFAYNSANENYMPTDKILSTTNSIIGIYNEKKLLVKDPTKEIVKNKLFVKKINGPLDEKGNKALFLEIGKTYSYEVVNFNRTPKKEELKSLKWAIQYDNGRIVENKQFRGRKIVFKVKNVTNNYTITVYSYFKEPTTDVSIVSQIEGEYPKVYISTEKTGFTIQKLYGHPAAKAFSYSYEPAVIVETYKAYLKVFKNGKTEDLLSFNVTRDSWWYLGLLKDGKKYKLLNRTFEPKEGDVNLFNTEEIHFPSKAPSDCKGYFLMQNKSRNINAEPFETTLDVNGRVIEENRVTADIANNVMLHIGGVYKAATLKGLGYEWLGGSLGCFAFIPQNDIYNTSELAKQASVNDDYDDDLSNSHWLKITSKIDNMRDKDKCKRFFIIINKRVNWIKTKEINLDELLKE